MEDFPGDSSSLHDIWAGLTGLFDIKLNIVLKYMYFLDAIPFHVKNLITFAREVSAIFLL
jgi:hypothetical protein